MIQASIGNARDFDKIAEALVIQHPRIHLKSTPSHPSRTHRGKGHPSPAARKGKSRGKGRGRCAGARYRRNPSGFVYQAADDSDCEQAYVADHSLYDEPFADPATGYDDDYYYDDADAYNAYGDEEEYEDQEAASGDWESFTAHISDEWNRKWSAVDPTEQAELDCLVCMYEEGMTLDDPVACAAYIQDMCTAYIAKGKGKGKGKFKYPVRPSNLSIEDRKKSTCQAKGYDRMQGLRS